LTHYKKSQTAECQDWKTSRMFHETFHEYFRRKKTFHETQQP